MRKASPALLIVVCTLGPAIAAAATAPRAVQSPLSGNGHNVSFDGRLYLVTQGNGWNAMLLRPERVRTIGGFPDVSQALSPSVQVQPPDNSENALALCEATPQPYRCESNGDAAASGAFDCYDEYVIDSNALGDHVFRRRRLLVVVERPRTATAAIRSFQWKEGITPLAPTLRGIEATVSKDGKLLMWNGSLNNGPSQGQLVYSVNSTACAASGWSAPKSITEMVQDPAVQGRYRLAERQLRAAGGELYPPGAPLSGAYPWLFPSGEAVVFTATNMPCRKAAGSPGAPDGDPPGCGPIRNAWSVLGYPTNWTLSHVDGAVNPATDDVVRLFFSSPGPELARPLPATQGIDVWPFFGSNTSNYTEVVFDDGLDGDYGGIWHMNELITLGGVFDLSRTPDSSGYANTGRLNFGAVAPGLLGGEVNFSGAQPGTPVANAPALNPTDVLTVELNLRASSPDCDGNNNWRVVLLKGTDLGNAAYSLVLEEGRFLQARVRVAGGATYNVFGGPMPAEGARLAFTYRASTGTLALWINGSPVAQSSNAPATLAPNTSPLYVGGPPTAPAACSNGFGGLQGSVANLTVSTRELRSAARFPGRNNGVLGKAVELDGELGRMEVPHAASLSPVNALTMQLSVKPASPADCDGNNNYRILLAKGPQYSLILEDNMRVHARVRIAGGGQYSVLSSRALPVGEFTQVTATYKAARGALHLYFGTEEVGVSQNVPALLEGTPDALTVGGPPLDRPACPNGDGSFHGTVDEVSISRIVRTPLAPSEPADAGTGTDAGDRPPSPPGGCGCDGAGSALALLALALVWAGAPKRSRGLTQRRG